MTWQAVFPWTAADGNEKFGGEKPSLGKCISVNASQCTGLPRRTLNVLNVLASSYIKQLFIHFLILHPLLIHLGGLFWWNLTLMQKGWGNNVSCCCP